MPVTSKSAQQLGKSVEMWASMLIEACRAEFLRNMCQMTLDLIVDTYRENPRIGTGDDADRTAAQNQVQRAFNITQDIIPQAVQNGANFSAPLPIELLFQLTALTNIATGVTENQESSLYNGIKGATKVFITTSSNFAQFQIHNKNFNKDFFSKPIFDEMGYGKMRKIQDILFVELHDEYLPKGTYDASAANVLTDNITFPLPANLTGYLNRGSSTVVASQYDSANHTTVQGLHQSLFLPVSALDFYKPEQYNIDLFDFRDKDLSHEKVLYGRIAIQGMRKYDDVCWRIWNTDSIGQNLNVIT